MVLRRLCRLYLGLALYGVSLALMVHAALGLDPWDVFHQGFAGRAGLSFGTATVLTGVLVLLCWIPLRQRPGLGTVSNVLVIGPTVDLVSPLLPTPHGLLPRFALFAVGLVLNAAATGWYLGAGFGPGPRDGLMTGIHRRTGHSLRLVRTAIEVSVLIVGFLLGGTVGLGTLAYALGIGPLVQFFLPRLTPGQTGGKENRAARRSGDAAEDR
ncbi:YitT family protein [Amycolatopsis sp. NPDC059021]|uniref:membrane protein YczE n=1 Tax=Amycolatopsis sp. NPDC059021 TaxID=3346704 RepID=UPI00366EEDE1